MERQSATPILPDTDPDEPSEAHAGQPATLLIPWADVEANPDENQRKTPPDSALEGELLSDMRARVLAGQHPQKQPVEVERRGDRWVLVSGFTRHRVVGRLLDTKAAETKAGGAWGGTLWCSRVEPKDGYGRSVINLRENLIRSELPPADLAEAVSKLRASTGRDVAEIARDIGRPLSSVANIVRAYERTTPEMWTAFRKGALQQKQIIALAAQSGDEQRLSFEQLMGGGAGPSAGASKPPRETSKAAGTSAPDDDVDDVDDDAAPDPATRKDAARGARLRLAADMLSKTPGFKDSKHDFVMGMRALVRFCNGKHDPAVLGAEVEALLAQAGVRDGREAPDPRQLVIPPLAAADRPQAMTDAKARVTFGAKAAMKPAKSSKPTPKPAKATKPAKPSKPAGKAGKGKADSKGRR